ncbi:hypothetical protein GCM10023196_043310 [Actinoallomurus vinaceus]|uniref:FAD/NAD(P)-binding domain-containing protein n=1 Tax=Actinoallomurus vinaceus TaxID=1080074 RepID=A0ABP8UEQ2_9ACTN
MIYNVKAVGFSGHAKVALPLLSTEVREKLDHCADAGQTGAVYDFDVLVLGTGPGGQKAAIAAAKRSLLYARVAAAASAGSSACR